VFLARSIGIWAEAPNEIRNGEAYETYLEGITENLPCIKQKNRKIIKRDLISESAWVAKEIGKDQYYGFTLDGDGRFLLGDFTVTHNTTTLSATMYAIDRKRWNVITAENPVEIRIPHVEQTPIDGSQLTFAKFVPAALRQDPDYIMIGETRDKETTEEVIRAAITGHIVMTTLHTNSAAGAPGRLIDMGGQPFLITDALKTVCAQRLIRRLCPNCSRPVRKIPTKDELKRMHIDPKWIESAEYLLEPVGCKLCNNTGYKGRVAIVEGYFTSPEIRRIIIHDNADTEKIRREIEHQGGKTLFQHAVEHVARGTTSLAEALTVRNLDG
jgi:type II secretory ATPase GspE/PulE/Tfp pilus assembly ATPase PilB-like protein